MHKTQRRELPALTGLRGTAALWVFAYHLYKSFAGDGAHLFTSQAIPFLREGWRGVDLFFVLSGFVIAHVHLRDFERPGVPQLWSYATRRFWRVYPLNAFWHAAVVLLFLVAPAVLTMQPRYDPASLTPEAFAAGVLLVQAWVPGYTLVWNWPSWSLSAEIAAYLLFPLMAVGANRVQRPEHGWLLAALALTALGIILYLRGKLGANAAGSYNGLLRSTFCFAAGVAMCRAIALAPLSDTAANRLGAAGVVLAILGCASGSWGPVRVPLSINYLCVPAAALLIVAASAERGVTMRLLSGRGARRLGDVSFSLYLSHWPVILILRAALVGRGPDVSFAFAAGAVAITMVATAAITYLSWRYIEAPMHRFGRKIGKAAPEPATARPQ